MEFVERQGLNLLAVKNGGCDCWRCMRERGLLLALPWQEREDVCSAITNNDIFCVYCGYGSPETPNPNCQCTNDD